MDNDLKILFVEDDPVDAEFAVSTLKKSGLACVARRVQTGGELVRELEAFAPDIVLCDFTLPGFDGMSALKIVRETRPDTPLIFLSGTIGEETAIETLKRGAVDYILKSSLKRLAPAIRRALKDAEEHAERKRAEQQRVELTARLQKYQEQISGILATVPGVVWEQYGQPDTATHCVNFVSEYITTLTGYSIEDWLTTPDFWLVIMHPDDRAQAARTAVENFSSGKGGNQHFRWITKDGRTLWVESTYRVIPDARGAPMGLRGATFDITARKQGEEAISRQRAFLRQIIDLDPNFVFAKDLQGRFTLANQAISEAYGTTPDRLTGKTDADFNPDKQEVAKFQRDDQEVFETLKTKFIPAEKLTDAGGRVRWFQTVKRPLVSPAGTAELVLGVATDITLRKQQEERIARLSRIHALLSGINSLIVRSRDRQQLFEESCRIAVEKGGFNIGWIAVLDPASGKLMPVAQAGLPLHVGAGGDSSDSRAGLVPAGVAEVVLREKRPAIDNDIGRGPDGMKGGIGPDTLSVRQAAVGLGAKAVIVLPLNVEGRTFGVLTLYAPEPDFFDADEVKLLTELAGDISFGLEFIAKEEKVDYLAYYDTLSGLPNRSLFFDRLAHQLGSAAREGLNVALVLMDINRFRLVNDTLGRQAGDALISAVAQRIRDTFRDEDAVARIGADGFAVSVAGTWQAADAAHFLEAHHRRIFGEPFLLGKEELRMSATAGVALFPGDGNDADTLFANAETAVKKAKLGGERFLFFSPEMNARVADSLRLENRLRRALENGEMVLWYQPKVDVRTRAILGFEALMRWRDPESTLMVPPAQFIPLMEQTGLILEAGRWALSQIARDCRQWSTSGIAVPRVAVNVSPIQLRQKDFVATMVNAARETEEAGAALDLEITESVIMENVEAIIPLLQTVRGLGVQIAVDDFGTGYSSLAYIARLPIHELKIDRSFVIRMTESQDSLAIVRSVISLAHSLRLIVVAEGVETEQQAALLLELGCDQMQGYLVSRPVPPAEALKLIHR